MKKFTYTVLFLLLTALFRIQADAVNITLGPVVWYAWWSPMYMDSYARILPKKVKLIEMIGAGSVYDRQSWESSGAFLAGPAVSVKFSENWSISSVFTLNSPYSQTSSTYEANSYDNTVKRTDVSLTAKKYDLDLTLSYSAFNYLKIFAGFKYQGYSYQDMFRVADIGAPYSLSYKKYNGDSDGFGGGLGLGSSLPLAENLYLLGNFSGVYLNTNTLQKRDHYFFRREKIFQYYNALGFNATLSFAYNIPAASVTISLGGRFQMLKFYARPFTTTLIDATTALDRKIYNEKYISTISRMTFDGTKDYFYGMTFSVTYNFTI